MPKWLPCFQFSTHASILWPLSVLLSEARSRTFVLLPAESW